jgi:hypothetical protein
MQASIRDLDLGAASLKVLEDFKRVSHLMSGDHEDPPVIVAWHMAAVANFLAAAAAVGAPAPFQFPQGAIDEFRAALLAYVAAQAAPPANVIEATVISCSTVQAMQVTGTLMVLGQSAWAMAVWAQMPAASHTPIATLYTPRPHATNGACLRVLAAPAGIFD